MNDLVNQSRAPQRGFPCSESRLCILQERARHSKSSPHNYASYTPFLMQYQPDDKRFFANIAIVSGETRESIAQVRQQSFEYIIKSIIAFHYVTWNWIMLLEFK